MKKNALVIMLICCAAIMCFITGYFASKIGEPEPEPKPDTESPTEEVVSTIPDATDFPEIEWPTFGFATRLPTPDWSNRGEIVYSTERDIHIHIGYSTLEDFENYVEACKELGYTENTYSVPGITYYGENAEGNAAHLHYNQYEHYVTIIGKLDGASYFKYWLKED